MKYGFYLILIFLLNFLTVNSYSKVIDSNFLIKKCASGVPEKVALALISQESNFNPYAINVNKRNVLFKKPKNKEDAIEIAKKLIDLDYNIDMGYAQINSNNLKKLGLTVNQIFDTCTNLKAMQYILSDCYNRANGNNRLQKAFSCYNTGNHILGFSNGYVRKVTMKYNSLYDLETNKDKDLNFLESENKVVDTKEIKVEKEYNIVANQSNLLENNHFSSPTDNDNLININKTRKGGNGKNIAVPDGIVNDIFSNSE